jgi:hypothetical protein
VEGDIDWLSWGPLSGEIEKIPFVLYHKESGLQRESAGLRSRPHSGRLYSGCRMIFDGMLARECFGEAVATSIEKRIDVPKV